MAQSEAARRAKEKYDARTAKGLFLKLNVNTDADILQRLEEVGNKQGYIKELIRNDLSRTK